MNNNFKILKNLKDKIKSELKIRTFAPYFYDHGEGHDGDPDGCGPRVLTGSVTTLVSPLLFLTARTRGTERRLVSSVSSEGHVSNGDLLNSETGCR